MGGGAEPKSCATAWTANAQPKISAARTVLAIPNRRNIAPRSRVSPEPRKSCGNPGCPLLHYLRLIFPAAAALASTFRRMSHALVCLIVESAREAQIVLRVSRNWVQVCHLDRLAGGFNRREREKDASPGDPAPGRRCAAGGRRRARYIPFLRPLPETWPEEC